MAQRNKLTFEEHKQRAADHLRRAATILFQTDQVTEANQLREMAVKLAEREFGQDERLPVDEAVQ